MRLHILNPGPLTTVQDKGRFGYMEYGVTTSGAMDQKAYRQANQLVNNSPDAAVLEATLMGPTIQIEGEGFIGFMGADMNARLDDIPIQRGQAYEVKDGQILSFGIATEGVRLYLAVAGGINVPEVMGSRSTNLKIESGGFWGRKLLTGDVIETFPFHTFEKKKGMSIHLNPDRYEELCEIRVIPGPQDDYFTSGDFSKFFGQEYTITPESDRMGIRLSGPQLEGTHGMDIISDGITFGSIQVTSKGLPIILMADHQTTGGYAKIATVITEDLPLLAQARPGTKIRFREVTVESVQNRGNLLKKIIRRLAG